MTNIQSYAPSPFNAFVPKLFCIYHKSISQNPIKDMVAYKCHPDNEIISRQLKFLSRLIIILSRLPVKKVIATTGRDYALKCHRDVNIRTQPFSHAF